jgi:hypothetical protein
VDSGPSGLMSQRRGPPIPDLPALTPERGGSTRGGRSRASLAMTHDAPNGTNRLRRKLARLRRFGPFQGVR